MCTNLKQVAFGRIIYIVAKEVTCWNQIYRHVARNARGKDR